MIQALYTVGSPFSYSAIVAVINKPAFKNGVDIIINEMVNNSVSKIRCKDFPLNGIKYNKTDTTVDFILFVFDLLVELK